MISKTCSLGAERVFQGGGGWLLAIILVGGLANGAVARSGLQSLIPSRLYDCRFIHSEHACRDDP